MSTSANSTARIPRESLRIAADQHPGWASGADRLPAIGEHVQCTDGLAQVTRILGKTGDGSRLLELTLPDRPRHPFFAAASNVLVPPLAAAG